jgi:hypothetical protein
MLKPSVAGSLTGIVKPICEPMDRVKKLLADLVLLFACISGHSQGVLDFANAGPYYVARVYDTDGTTALAGTNYSADLYWAPGIVADSCALQPLNAPAFFSSIPSQAGLFFGGPRTLPVAPGTTITAQIRVWPTAAGSSWLDAGCALVGGHIGASILFSVTLAASPDTADMTGLNGHPFALNAHLLDVLVWVQNVRVLPNQVAFDIVPNSVIPIVVVEATTNLTSPVWFPVQTYNCVACPISFTDTLPLNSLGRFYRVGWRF